jgi:hypothetical protein
MLNESVSLLPIYGHLVFNMFGREMICMSSSAFYHFQKIVTK